MHKYTEDLSPTEQELIKNEALGFVSHEITLDYDYWNSGKIKKDKDYIDG
jgi:tRNA (guanine37-N1)-methyltransferase